MRSAALPFNLHVRYRFPTCSDRSGAIGRHIRPHQPLLLLLLFRRPFPDLNMDLYLVLRLHHSVLCYVWARWGLVPWVTPCRVRETVWRGHSCHHHGLDGLDQCTGYEVTYTSLESVS